VILIYRLAWTGSGLARYLRRLLFLFSPLAWFHGTVALTYSVEAAASHWWGRFAGASIAARRALFCLQPSFWASQQGFGRRPFSFLAVVSFLATASPIRKILLG